MITQLSFAQVNGGSIALRSTAIDTTILIDGVASPITIVQDGLASGAVTTFVITDTVGKILELPAGNGPFDLEGAGAGVCQIWFLAYEMGLTGLAVDNNVADLVGTFDFSNAIRVTRELASVSGTYVARLSGQQQNPTALSAARGQVIATVRGNLVSFEGDFSQLTDDFDANIAGGAHIHLGVAGKNGPIVFPLTTVLDGDLNGGQFLGADNTFTLSASQLMQLEADEFYLNIHTLEYPGGELRGQFTAGSGRFFQTTLLGSNEVPSIVSPAYGNLLFTLDNNFLTVTGSFDDLTDSIATDIAGGAHIHLGFAGELGPVAFPLNLTIDADQKGAVVEASNNTFTLTPDQINALLLDSTYVNVHSQNFRSGELRGQISQLGLATFRGQLTGMQELPAVNVGSTGRMHVTFGLDDSLRFSGSFKDLSSNLATSISGGIHVHIGTSGQNGPIEYILTPTVDGTNRNAVINPALNTFAIDNREDELFDREMYVNVHSENFPTGELRGQILPLAKTYLGADMSGFNEVEAAYTFGRGNWQFELTDNELTVSGGFFNMISDFDASIAGGCHLHYGTARENGPIALILNPRVDPDLRSGTFPTDDNKFTISDGLRDSILAGQIYVNLHSQRYPMGELRSQLLRDDNKFPRGAIVINSPITTDTILLEDDAALTFDVASMNLTDPDGDSLVYNYQLSLVQDFSQTFYTKKVSSAEPAQFNAADIYQAAIDTGLIWLTPRTVYQRMNVSDGAVSIFGSRDPFTLTLKPNVAADGGSIALANGAVDTVICIDGVANPIDVVLDGSAAGTNFNFVITDLAGNILDLPAGNGPFDLDGAGVGTCQIWYLASHIDLMGAAVGNNVSDLTGSFNLSNPITVYRQAPDAGIITLLSGATDTTVVVGSATFTLQHSTAADRLDYNYVLTDDQDRIIAALDPSITSTLSINGIPLGTYRVYGWSFLNLDEPILGANISTLTDDACETITDAFVTIVLEMPSSTQDFDADTQIKVFPNPAQDFVQVAIEQPSALETSASLYSTTSQLLAMKQGTAQAFSLDFDLSALPAGTYSIVIRRGDQVAVRNVVKE